MKNCNTDPSRIIHRMAIFISSTHWFKYVILVAIAVPSLAFLAISRRESGLTDCTRHRLQAIHCALMQYQIFHDSPLRSTLDVREAFLAPECECCFSPQKAASEQSDIFNKDCFGRQFVFEFDEKAIYIISLGMNGVRDKAKGDDIMQKVSRIK